MHHRLHICPCVAFSISKTSTLLRMTMDKSGMAKSNYEEKLHSCPRNHLCQRPHNETQGLLKWAWQAQRILIFSPLILSPRTCIIKPVLIKASIWKWWMVAQIGNVFRGGVWYWKRGGKWRGVDVEVRHTNIKSHIGSFQAPSCVANSAGDGLSGLIGVLTKIRR